MYLLRVFLRTFQLLRIELRWFCTKTSIFSVYASKHQFVYQIQLYTEQQLAFIWVFMLANWRILFPWWFVTVLNLDLDEVAEKKLKESKLLSVVPVMPFDKPLLKEIDLNTLEVSWLPATLPPTAHQTPIRYQRLLPQINYISYFFIHVYACMYVF